MRKIAILLLLFSLSSGVGKLWHSLKDGFSICRIGSALPSMGSSKNEGAFSEEWLSGPFYYLGRGRQCYAFESADRRYVLKIPRFDRYELPFIWKVPFSFLAEKRKSIAGERKNRKAFLLSSFSIAARDLKEETAVLHLHLYDTGALLGRTALIDRLGRRYEVDLNRIVFVLQKKKPLMMPQFLAAIAKKDSERTLQILDALLAILKKRARLGIFNKDPSFMKNYAWEEGRGVLIDIGSLYRKEGLAGEKAYWASLRQNSDPIREWLGSLDAALLCHFDKGMEEACADFY